MTMKPLPSSVAYRSGAYKEVLRTIQAESSTSTNRVLVLAGAQQSAALAAAEVAAQMGKPLVRLDLGAVVSKYIGETEKNLELVFRDAQAAGAVLYFDEADALFGTRSDVKDSHDRYANLDTAYLLQKIEDYEGLLILASNRAGDSARDRWLERKVIVTLP
jgi:SpoVK/Ycf46/Vps4 family AAA+-type ATPase